MNALLKHLKRRKIGDARPRCIYGNAVYAFSQYAGKMPDADVSMEKTEIEKLIDDFCYYKMEKKEWKSSRTANTALFMLKTFFKLMGSKASINQTQ